MLNKKRGAFNMKYNDRSEFEKVDSFGIGAPNDAYAQYFIGKFITQQVVVVRF